MLALAIFTDENRTVLAGKKTLEEGKEYLRFWSIPSQRITQKEYRMIQDGYSATKVIERLCNNKLSHLSVGNIRLLKFGERRWKKYDLKMLLLGCDVTGTLPIKTKYYDPIQPKSIFSILESNAFKSDTCVSLLHQYLIDVQEIEPGIDFLEIPPSINLSDRELEEYRPEELWSLAAGNYRLLTSGKLGGDGYSLRSVTLERALNRRFDRLVSANSKFLDIGCGDGKIVEQLRTRTPYAYGLEIQTDFDSHHLDDRNSKDFVVTGNIYSLKTHFADSFFDVVLLNLVIQWLPDLDLALSQLKDIVAPKGTVIVTITTPNATHCGRWKYNNGAYIWEQNKRIPKRKLVMINRMVGPLWFFGYSTLAILNKFQAHGFIFREGEEIFLDSYQTENDLKAFLERWPAFHRSLILPPFILLELMKQDK